MSTGPSRKIFQSAPVPTPGSAGGAPSGGQSFECGSGSMPRPTLQALPGCGPGSASEWTLMGAWPTSYAQLPPQQIAIFRLKGGMNVNQLQYALATNPALAWIITDPITGGTRVPNNHAIRTSIKRTVMGHRRNPGQVGGKAPVLNVDQVTRLQAMVANAEHRGGVDMSQLTHYVLEIRKESGTRSTSGMLQARGRHPIAKVYQSGNSQMVRDNEICFRLGRFIPDIQLRRCDGIRKSEYCVTYRSLCFTDSGSEADAHHCGPMHQLQRQGMASADDSTSEELRGGVRESSHGSLFHQDRIERVGDQGDLHGVGATVLRMAGATQSGSGVAGQAGVLVMDNAPTRACRRLLGDVPGVQRARGDLSSTIDSRHAANRCVVGSIVQGVPSRLVACQQRGGQARGPVSCFGSSTLGSQSGPADEGTARVLRHRGGSTGHHDGKTTPMVWCRMMGTSSTTPSRTSARATPSSRRMMGRSQCCELSGRPC